MNHQRISVHLWLLAICALVCAACTVPMTAPALEAHTPVPSGQDDVTSVAVVPQTNLTEGCVEHYEPGIDYFPEKIDVTHASFSVEYFDNYKLVSVNDPWLGAEQSFQYLIVQCGTPAPDGYGDLPVIEVPVSTIVALSTTYLPQLESLGRLDRLVAVDSGLWTTTEAVQERVAAGDVIEVGMGTAINVEQLLDLDPDLIMSFGIGSPEYDSYPMLMDAGLPVVLNGDFVEQEPLGRTEWIKFLALFFNLESEAQAIFSAIEQEYEEVAALAASADNRPTVFLSSVYDGTWWMAGGGSYMAQMLEDAGAEYLWADSGSVGSNPIAFETVVEVASDADFWLNPDNSFWLTVDDVLASDERYGSFAALQAGHLYNNNAIVNENGGNAILESGAANPHIVLRDLVKIFHPELLPDHELVYYRQVQ